MLKLDFAGYGTQICEVYPRRIDALYKARDISIQDFGFKIGSVCIFF